MAGFGPMPSSGIITPSRAMLGMVCNIPATPSMVPASLSFREISIPNGIPISTANNKEMKVRPVCVSVCSASFSRCSNIKDHKLCCSFISTGF